MRAGLFVAVAWLAAAAYAATPPDRPAKLILDTDMSGDCDDAGTREWPTEIVWQGFEVGDPVITGEGLKDTPRANPVRRAYEVRRFGSRSAIDGGQPSYDQAAALYAVRGPDPELWREERGGTVTVDDAGLTHWEAGTGGRHVLVHRACVPEILAGRIETLMTAPPAE